MRPILALNCLLQIEQERSWEESSFGDGVVRLAACMVVDPVAVSGFASLFGCVPAGWASGSVMVPAWGLA